MNTIAPRRVATRAVAACIACIACTAFGALACSTSSAGRGAAGSRGVAGDVVIGVAWPWAAHPEIRFGQGLDLAVEEVNKSGGVLGRKLRLRREDDRESVDSGRMVAERLSSDRSVVAVIGHLQSYVTIPAAAIYDANGIVLLSPTSTDPELTAHAYRRVFRTTFTDRSVGYHMAEYAAARGYKRVAIYYVRNDYGRGVSNAFEERASDLGITVADRQSYDAEGGGADDAFATRFRQWAHLDADALLVAGEVPLAGTLIAQARKAGVRLPVLGVDAMGSPELMATGGQAVEGAVVPTVFHPDETRPEVKEFTSNFQTRYGVAPDAGSALGYDAVWLLARAIRAAGSSAPDEIARALHAARDSKGVTGALTFDATGDLTDRPLEKMVVHHGRFEYLAETGRPRTTAASQ